MKPEIFFGLFNFPELINHHLRKPLIRWNVLQYYVIYKPYLVLSQFSLPSADAAGSIKKQTLKDMFDVPRDVYPVGRLDHDSEGLLILTNDTSLNHRLLNPRFSHAREYWAQVEGIVTDEALDRLRTGVIISVDGKNYKTKKASAHRFTEPPDIPPRKPPIRFRKNIPDSWISLILSEGKNRQVRKMTAGVGFPTLRLVRMRIAQLSVGEMKPGDIKALSREEIYGKLFPDAK
jgi:23S rRNA pseudouridine2457 synthase